MRLALAASLVLAATAWGREPPPTRPVKARHHRWKCTFVGRIVYCDLVDRPLAATRRDADTVLLVDRAPPDFAPLVSPPASFR